jgi:FkbM family methyltransferase
MIYLRKTSEYFKSSLYLIFFPIFKYIVILFFKIRGTKLRGAFYNSLSYVKGLSYFCVNTGKELFIVNLEDKEIGKGLFCKGLFDYDKLLNAVKIIKDNNANFDTELLVDVGANIGTISVPAITRNEFNSVVAFEPNPENFKLLRNNLIINNIEDKFEIYQCAVGNIEGDLDLELSNNNSGDHRISVSNENGLYDEGLRNRIKVKSITLDSILNNIEPNKTLFWIDVQGYEGHVLSGANEALKNKVPVVIEFWPYGLNRTDGFNKLKSSLSLYSGFYDLSSPNVFYDISKLDFYFTKIGLDGNFVDLLVL